MQTELKSRNSLLRILGTGLALILMVYLLRQQDWGEIMAAIGQIQAWRFLMALALMMCSRFFVIGRWHWLLRSGGVDVTWQQSSRITFAGLFANNFLPTTVGGDLARLGGALHMGFDAAISTASLVVDRVVGLAGMALALPIGLMRVLEAQTSTSTVGVLQILLAAEAGFLSRWSNRLVNLVRRVLAALQRWLARPSSLLISFGFTFLHMACLFAAISILLTGMGEPLPFLQIAGLWSLVYLITLLPFSINALGLQELSVTYAFSQLGGISTANSVVLALLVRALFMLASLPGAFFLSELLPGAAQARLLLNKLDY
jgi:hypothetical protein